MLRLAAARGPPLASPSPLVVDHGERRCRQGYLAEYLHGITSERIEIKGVEIARNDDHAAGRNMRLGGVPGRDTQRFGQSRQDR